MKNTQKTDKSIKNPSKYYNNKIKTIFIKIKQNRK